MIFQEAGGGGGGPDPLSLPLDLHMMDCQEVAQLIAIKGTITCNWRVADEGQALGLANQVQLNWIQID